jgi:hypothetical protein
MWDGSGKEDENLIFAVTKKDTDGDEQGDSYALQVKGHIEALSGEIAGWTITDTKDADGNNIESSITKGNPGVAGGQGFGLYTYYPNDKGAGVGNSEVKTNWRILVDNKFGVDGNGYVYAAAGKIGDMEIGQLVGRAEQVVGKNLLLGTDLKYQNQSYPIHSYDTSASDFNDDDWYTISFMANLGEANTSYPWYGIDIYNSGGTVILAHIPASDISVKQDKYYSIPF